MAILNLLSEKFKLIFIYKSPIYFLQSFRLTGILVQEEKCKIDEDGGHLGFQFEMILTQCFLSSFKSTGLLVQEKNCKIDFQEGGQGWPAWISN